MAFAYDTYTTPSKNNGVLGATLTKFLHHPRQQDRFHAHHLPARKLPPDPQQLRRFLVYLATRFLARHKRQFLIGKEGRQGNAIDRNSGLKVDSAAKRGQREALLSRARKGQALFGQFFTRRFLVVFLRLPCLKFGSSRRLTLQRFAMGSWEKEGEASEETPALADEAGQLVDAEAEDQEDAS